MCNEKAEPKEYTFGDKIVVNELPTWCTKALIQHKKTFDLKDVYSKGRSMRGNNAN